MKSDLHWLTFIDMRLPQLLGLGSRGRGPARHGRLALASEDVMILGCWRRRMMANEG